MGRYPGKATCDVSGLLLDELRPVLALNLAAAEAADLDADVRMKRPRGGGAHPGNVVRTDPPRGDIAAERTIYQKDLWHYTIARMVDACQANGGFYLGSIGGPAARLAQDCITHVEVLDFPENGMEAVWKIEVHDFPAFVVVDDKGNDFFAETLRPVATTIPVGPPA